jgi:hypothetical protein
LDKNKKLHTRGIAIRFEYALDETLIAYSTNKDARCIGKVENDLFKGMIEVL